MASSKHQDPQAERLAVLLREVMSLVYRRFAGETMVLMSDTGLTMPQMVALNVLRYAGPQSIGGLVEKLHLSISATSHLVDRLVEKALVDRQEDPDDRRQKRVEITAAGSELVDRIARVQTSEFARVLSSLDPDLQAQLATAFERAVEQLRADPNYYSRPPESR